MPAVFGQNPWARNLRFWLGIYAFGQLYTIIPLEIFAFDLEAGIYGLNTSKG